MFYFASAYVETQPTTQRADGSASNAHLHCVREKMANVQASWCALIVMSKPQDWKGNSKISEKKQKKGDGQASPTQQTKCIGYDAFIPFFQGQFSLIFLPFLLKYLRVSFPVPGLKHQDYFIRHVRVLSSLNKAKTKTRSDSLS